MDKNNKWTIVGVVFTILSFIAAAAALFPLTKSKSLSYEVRSETSFSQINDFGKFEFNFYDHKLINPQLTVLRISNDGSIPISAIDFDGPLKIVFPDFAIEAIRVASTNPDGIPVRASKAGNEVHIEPMLLNAGDTFDLSILTSGSIGTAHGLEKFFEFKSQPQVIARISDLSAASKKATASQMGGVRYPLLLILCLSIAYFSGANILILGFRSYKITTRKFLPEAVAIMASMFGAIFSLGPLHLQITGLWKILTVTGYVAVGIIMAYRAFRLTRTTTADS